MSPTHSPKSTQKHAADHLLITPDQPTANSMGISSDPVADTKAKIAKLRAELKILEASAASSEEEEKGPMDKPMTFDSLLNSPVASRNWRERHRPEHRPRTPEVPRNDPAPMGQTFHDRPQMFYAAPHQRSVPSMKELQLSIPVFDGSETYPGLGSRFYEWGCEFLREVELCEASSGMPWNEPLKINRLGRYLGGKAQAYFQKRYMDWWAEVPTLIHVMDRLNEAFRTHITRSTANRLLTAKKDPRRSWVDHYMYLVAVNDAVSGCEQEVV